MIMITREVDMTTIVLGGTQMTVVACPEALDEVVAIREGEEETEGIGIGAGISGAVVGREGSLLTFLYSYPMRKSL